MIIINDITVRPYLKYMNLLQFMRQAMIIFVKQDIK